MNRERGKGGRFVSKKKLEIENNDKNKEDKEDKEDKENKENKENTDNEKNKNDIIIEKLEEE